MAIMHHPYPYLPNIHSLSKTYVLVGELDTEKMQEAINALAYLDSLAPRKPLTIHLCSNGGYMVYALGIYDFIRTLKSNVRIIGLAEIASMAVVLLQAADKGLRYLHPRARIMLHRGSMSVPDYVHMTDFERLTKETKTLSDMADEIVCERMGISIAEFNKRFEHDTYIGGEEAIKTGLADKIYYGG